MISNKNQLTKALVNVADHELIRLVYVSKISKATRSDPLLFEHIRLHAEDYNRKNNIKGMLCNDHQYFLQCLEGQKQLVVLLMQRIFDDKRHNKVNIILLKDIKEFIFHDWRMRSFNLDQRLWTPTSLQANSPELKEFLPFNPLTWSPWFIEHFLKTMQKFDDSHQSYEADQESYNIIRDPQSRMISWFDSGVLHWVLFGLVVLLLILLINFNTLF
ncbi:blue light sensor protein [Psychrobacter sp. FDAARGOS_221]|nr:blue light sensor protein [Psychrobacter sp. FDAARGOS_221]